MIGQRAGALAALALAGLAGCRPGALGRCNQDQDCRAGAFCSTDRICLPRFAVTVFVPPAPDAVNGWVPRTAGNLEVRATVEDGTGQAVQGATLAFDACPAAAACSYPGTVLSQAGDTTEFSFQVPRFAQAAGSEAPLAVTVTATGAAGKQAHGAGALQIDDAPPQIGSFTAVTAATRGEDGKDWFAGGSGASPVEIAVPVTDAGAGGASLSLVLVSADVVNGTTLKVTGTPASDGTVHFQLPAAGVQGREGSLRFTLTATDELNNSVSVGPDTPKTMIFVDALPPVVPFAPRVDYTSAAGPAGTPQCVADTNIYRCGRQSSTYLLADDSATVSFDAYDCGSGMAVVQQPASISTKATTVAAAVNSNKPNSATQCTNGSGNKTHHYSFTLNLATAGLALDPPIDNNGTMLVKLAANANDRLQQVTQKGPGASQTSGDGLALVSVWRWKRQVAGVGTQPSGAPALLPGTAGARAIAVGTTLSASSPNFFVVGPDGAALWNATVNAIPITGDIAVGPSGRSYVVSPPAASCTGSCSGVLSIVVPPTTGATGTLHACTPANNVSFGTSPAIIAGATERAIVASVNHNVAATANVFLFEENASGAGCQSDTSALVGAGADYSGISANWPTIFLATGQGFTSIDRNAADTGFDTTTQRAYNSTSTVPTSSPPAVASVPLRAIFGSISNDNSVHTAQQGTCAIGCWVDDGSFPTAHAGNPIPSTPVFDTVNVYASDNRGTVHAFPRATGTAGWSQDLSAALPAPWPNTTGGTVSAPVLLQDGSVLVARSSDGVVALASKSGIVPLVQTAANAAPVVPVIEVRGSGGVAYVPDGQGWLWAVQLNSPPLPPSQNVWPRPGRDSCNSRNAGSPCQ